MKRTVLASLLAALVMTATASLALAEATTWNFDQPHSEASFKIRHFLTTVNGRFNEMTGTIVFDDKDWSKSTVQATIKTASIFTNNDRRDNHLRSSDFFDAEKNPEITFKSTKVTPGADNKSMKIEGDLTMRGVTKPVVLDALYLGTMTTGMGAKSGFSAKTTVNRQDYGISWNKTLDQGGTMLGDDVAIELNIEANKVVPGANPPGAPPAQPLPAPTKK